MFDELSKLGDPYIDNFDQAVREQVLKCIRDKTGRFLDDDDFVTYVETEEEKQKPRYTFTGDAKVALTDYYDTVHTLCEAQQNFAVDFKCPMTPFKRLITGKRQPGGPGRSSEARGGSSRSLEEVRSQEGAPPAKRTRKATKSTAAAESDTQG